MGEGGTLKFAFHFNQLNIYWNIPGVCIYKADLFILADVFGHFGGELKVIGKIHAAVFWKFFLI